MCLSLNKNDKNIGKIYLSTMTVCEGGRWRFLLINLVIFSRLSGPGCFPLKQVVGRAGRWCNNHLGVAKVQVAVDNKRAREQHLAVGGKRGSWLGTTYLTIARWLETKKADGQQWRGHNSTIDHQQEQQKQSTAVGCSHYFFRNRKTWAKVPRHQSLFWSKHAPPIFLLSPHNDALPPPPRLHARTLTVHGNQY